VSARLRRSPKHGTDYSKCRMETCFDYSLC